MSWGVKSKWRAFLVALAACCSSTNALAVELDKLTRCADLEQIWRSVDSNTALGSCRSSRGELERAVESRLPPTPLARWCFIASASTSFMQNFSCFQLENDHRAATCFRGASMRDVQDFRDNYHTTYADQVADYLSAAARCPASNGESMIVPTHIQSVGPLSFVSASELGFGVLLGSDGHGSAYHGFARIDGTLGLGVDALEIIHVASGVSADHVLRAASALHGRTVGRWVLRHESVGLGDRSNSPELDRIVRAYRRMVADAGVRAQFAFANFDLANAAIEQNVDRESTLNRLQDTVISGFEESDFDYIREDEAADLFGRDYDEMSDVLSDGLAFGVRDTVRLGRVRMLVREFACSNADGSSGVLATVMSYSMENTSPRQYGSVLVAVTAMGRCSSSTVVDREIDQTLERTRRWVEAYLERR